MYFQSCHVTQVVVGDPFNSDPEDPDLMGPEVRDESHQRWSVVAHACSWADVERRFLRKIVCCFVIRRDIVKGLQDVCNHFNLSLPLALLTLSLFCRNKVREQVLTTGDPGLVGFVRTPLVDLPLGATEDRVCGTIDFERALMEGEGRLQINGCRDLHLLRVCVVLHGVSIRTPCLML